MDQAALVATDISKGSRILNILDRSGLRIKVAMWVHYPEFEDWRFALSSPDLDAAGPAAAYGLVHDALDGEGFRLEQTPALQILKMKGPFVRELRQIFRRASSVEGMRLGGQMIGDRFINDAIVYRIR